MVSNNKYRDRVPRIAIGIILLIFLTMCSASAETITVNASVGEDYSRIQDAIDNASAGDTILVDRGTYYENVNVTKQLIMRGIGMPVVDARGSGSAITLSADGIRLEGFTATGVGAYLEAGIKITSNNNTLIGNIVHSNILGIYLDSSSSNILRDNTAHNNDKGIQLKSSSNNNVSGNTANFNSEGIRLDSISTHNLLTGNNANSNFDTGIRFLDSSDNTLHDNLVSNNINSGIELAGGCTNNSLSSNNASNNSNGIRLSFSDNDNNTLSGNTANSNLYAGISLGAGVYGGATNNILSGNIVLYNSIGIVGASSSINNKIFNNLLSNIKNIQVDANNIWNLTKTAGVNIIGGLHLGGNVWENPSGTGFSQTCVDNDKDDICDSPYTLDSSNIDYLPLVYDPVISNESPPLLTFTVQTPFNGSTINQKWVVITINSNELLNSVLLEWDGTNESMCCSGTSWDKRKISLSNGTHIFKVWGLNLYGKWNSTEMRVITVSTPPSDTEVGGGSGNGSVVSGPMAWNASNFPAFWHEDGISGEMLAVLQPDLSSSQRIINKMNLVYNTTRKIIPYKVYTETGLTVDYGLDASGSTGSSGGYYAKVGWLGKRYVAIYGKANKLSELVLEQKSTESKNLSVGETWNLGNNYSLKLDSIDATARRAWLFFNKSSTKLDDKVIQEGDVYTYYGNLAGESNVPFFVTFVDNITENSIRLKYTWLISDNVTIFNAGDRFGLMILDSEDPFELKNIDSITLSRNAIINLMAGLYLAVNDSPLLEYYPMMGAIPVPSNLSIQINNDDAYTNSTSVMLSISALNAQEMSFSNDSVSWSDWETFNTSKSWTLSSGDGNKTVYFKTRNSAGETTPVDDTIILDTTPPSLNITSPVSVSFVTSRTAIITWSTNNFADSLVKYGLIPGNYSFNVHLNESFTFHNVVLTNLSSDTNYYFIINSTDATGSMQSQEFIFWTPYDTFQWNSNLTNIEIQQLTDYEESVSSPVWIEDKIFYASNRTGNMDVWVMDKDGSNKTQITNSSSEEYPSDGWVLSENKSKIYKIIYVSRVNGHSSIWIIDGDGTNSIQLINDSYENLDPVLVSVPIPVIFGMQPSGTIDNNVPLINASYYSYYGNISKVNISVDGFDVTSNASISATYLSYIPTKPLGMGPHNFTVKVETDKNTKTFSSQSFDIRYIYNTSPQSCIVLNDTPRIGANISVGYGNISSVVMILDGLNVTSNLTIYPSYIEYIPNVPLVNGSHSVYAEVNTEAKSTMGFSDNKTWTFVLNNSMIPIPSCYGGSGGGGGGGGGYQKIIFASNRSGNFDLWMMNLNGTGLEQMNYEPSNETSAAWIESKVVYVSDKSGSKDIWSMDVNGSNKKQLTNSVLDENMPSSSYVGGIIYTESKEGVSNLYAMNTNGTGNIKITNISSFKAIPAHSSMFSHSNEGILYSSEAKGLRGIYIMNFEEKGPKAKFWNLYENYSLQAFSIDTKSNPAQAWLNLQRNGILKADEVVRVGESFFINDTGKVVLTAILNKISSSDNYFEVELSNVTQYSSIDSRRLFTNETKILVNKILLIISTPIPTGNSGNTRNTGNSGYSEYSGSGSSGSVGGGGGGSSGENYSNIEVVEKYDMQISKDVLTSYRFTHAKNPIMFVNITGNVSIGLITVSMEVLKNTSTFVNVTPEGLVYKNANIWVGTSGFAAPKNIKEALIKFRIDNAWMSANGVLASDIALMKWEGKSWIKLETKVLSKDDTNAYFEGKTNSFSPFALVAKTAEAPKPTVTRTPVETPKVTAIETATPEPTKKVPGFGIVLALLGLMTVVLRKRV